MPDVSVNVMIDGKTVFAHGVADSPDPYNAIISGLTAAGMHFHTVLALANQSPPPAPQASGAAAQQKGPSL
jgi:hypothetical protein